MTTIESKAGADRPQVVRALGAIASDASASHDGWPYTREPSGWFQIAWSDELARGAVVPVHVFGSHLVLCRAEDGSLRVFDAFCPHLGAHLGHGGTMQGDNLVCPFHGWEWGPTGENACIPYSSKVMSNLRLRAWEVREVDGLIVIWHDDEGQPPAWEPLRIVDFFPELDLADFQPLYPFGIELWPSVRVRPQFVVENIVDSAHFKYVHAAAQGSTITSFSANDHIFECSQRFEGRRPATLDIRTSGLGLMLGVFSVAGEVTHVEIQATTPIAGPRSALRGSVWVKRDPDDREVVTSKMQQVIAFQHEQLGCDIPIWENMRYQPNAPLVPEESGAYRALRKWAAQFYGQSA